MFPTLVDDFRDLTPEVYFGGCEVPRYLRRAVPAGTGPARLAEEIRTIACGAACSGYIDDEGLHFHLYSTGELHVDMSRPFIFVADPDHAVQALPDAWQTLRFLQEPVTRAIFMDRNRAVLVTKTPRTMHLCRELDRLWYSEEILALMPESLVNVGSRSRLLSHLMRLQEEGTLDGPTTMWEFYDTFGPILAAERLFLTLQEIRA